MAKLEDNVSWEFDTYSGRHRLVSNILNGDWTSYSNQCHLTVNGRHYIGLTEYWQGEFSPDEVKKPLLITHK